MNSVPRWLFVMALIFAVLFFFAMTIDFVNGEAQVIPANTILTLPSGDIQVLSEAEFLLSRSDMEAATVALAEAPINVKTIEKLKALNDNATLWTVVIAVTTGLFAFLAGHLLK